MAFRVKFTRDFDWPIVFDDGISPLTGRAKGFRIDRCSAYTNVVKNNKDEIEVIDGFWVNASTAFIDRDGVVTFN